MLKLPFAYSCSFQISVVSEVAEGLLTTQLAGIHFLVSCLVGMRYGPWSRISNKFPGDTNVWWLDFENHVAES